MVSLLTLFSLKFKISGTASAGLLISTVGKAASPARSRWFRARMWLARPARPGASLRAAASSPRA